MATMPPVPLSAPPVNGIAAQPVIPTAPDVTGQLMTITPSMAETLLQNRLPNRPVSKARVRALIDDLRQGRWQTNGESIILDQDLKLLDGQHRLMAVAESGIAITALVVVGVPHAAMPSIDSGRSKNGADQLHMAQMPQAQQLAATCRWLYRYERGSMRIQTTGLRDYQLPGYAGARPSLPASLPWGRTVKDLLPASCASMLFHVMTQHEAALSKRYYDALAHGDQLQRDDPAHVVRDRLLKDKSPRNHLGVVSRAALVVLGWNCLRKEKPMAPGLVWRGVTDPTVAFPQIV